MTDRLSFSAPDFREWGLSDAVIYSKTASRALARFSEQIGEVARSQAEILDAGKYPLVDDFARSYDFGSVRFALGDATLKGNYAGVLTVYDPSSYSYTGGAVIQVHDVFTDPYDLFDAVKGVANPDGVPNNIDGYFGRIYSGGAP